MVVKAPCILSIGTRWKWGDVFHAFFLSKHPKIGRMAIGTGRVVQRDRACTLPGVRTPLLLPTRVQVYIISGLYNDAF